MYKIFVLWSFCVHLTVICIISTCVQSSNSGHLQRVSFKDDNFLQMDQLLRPIRKMSRTKLIKMLIKQIKRVAKDDRKQTLKGVKTSDVKADNLLKNETSTVSKSDFELKTQRLQQKQLAMLNNQIFIPYEPTPLFTAYSAQPVYSINTFTPTTAFQPAEISAPGTTLFGNGQVLQFNLPFSQLNRLPVYVNEQLHSPAGQQVVRAFVEQQFASIRRSSNPSLAKRRWNRFLNLIRTNLNRRYERLNTRWSKQISRRSIDARFDMQIIQEGMTRIIGGLVGDLVGIVVEEVLQKRGEMIANGIRLMVGDLATFFISKSSLVLNLVLKNLSKLILFIK